MSPIRPEERSRYPDDWRAISERIRRIRARNRCECDGRCGRPRGHEHDPATGSLRCAARNGQPAPVSGARVVLTVAHLDHTPENNDEANLMALCQRCHLAYDHDHHAETRRRTRAARAGQELLF